MSKAKAKNRFSKGGPVRLGVVGLGGMGTHHVNNILADKVPGCAVTAVCDANPLLAEQIPEIPFFQSYEEMIESGLVDAILVVTPHYSHIPIGVAALQAGLHVLMEKPIAVHKADAERLLAAHKNRRQVFAAMFNLRTDPYYQKIRDMVQKGDLGEIRRVNWIITNWFRSEAYYSSGGWRATWEGEGGGVLLNQCPHNLDLLQWIFGMPVNVRGFCALGRYHDIEVEDDVTAYLEYANGATGVFITSTGEAPGTNRLEVVGEQGRLVFEEGKLKFTRNEIQTTEFSRTTASRFGEPPVWDVSIPLPAHRGEQHVGIMKNFVAAIRGTEKLIAPAAEGIHSLELANAILYSSLKEKTITLPLASRTYAKALSDLIAASKPRKKRAVKKNGDQDFTKSF